MLYNYCDVFSLMTSKLTIINHKINLLGLSGIYSELLPIYYCKYKYCMFETLLMNG